MIEQIFDENRLLAALGETHDIFSGKVWALYAAYGFKYDFCTFFVQENGAVIGNYYGKAAVFCPEDADCDFEELSEFLEMPMFGEVLMRYELAEKLGLSENAEKNNIVRFRKAAETMCDITKEDVDNTPALGKVYEILKDGFDIDYSIWYTDISHSTRHGISESYVYNGAATVTKMFTYGDVSFLSFVASALDARGTGAAGKLVRRVCLDECAKGRDVFLICRDAVIGFYEKCGFERTGFTAAINKTRR